MYDAIVKLVSFRIACLTETHSQYFENDLETWMEAKIYRLK